jgi:Carboxypeptidase regulatory-like domain/TonB dependent receptor/TonB-dependent Receptor Plug Domain
MIRSATALDRFRFTRTLIFFLASCCGVRSGAQVSTATVAGMVQDSTKASIPGASVKLINTQTGAENDTTTSHDGSFVLPGVIPGAYTLQFERKGFATTQLRGIQLNVGDTRTLLVRMKVGPLAESVTVDASGLTLNGTDGAVSTVVDRKLAEAVPLNGRTFQDLISMTPGIVTQSPQAAGQRSETQGDFSVNGQRPESNSFFVDGIAADSNGGVISGHSRTVSTGSAAGATALGTTQSLVSIEALQEFRVLTSSYSAEYGRTPGGQFTFLTRSGTNTPHGSLFYNYRGDTFDATDWFAEHGAVNRDLYGTSFSQNNFGGTLGAPVILPGSYNGRDKSFFFLSYEGLYLDQPTPQTYPYSPYFDYFNQPPPSGLLPLFNYCFPYSSAIYDNSGNAAGLGSALISPFALPAHLNSTTLRVDHTFSRKFAAFFRFADAPSYSQTKQLFSLSGNQIGNRTYSFGANTQLSANINNELRLGFIDNDSSVQTETDPNVYPNSYYLNQALGIPSSYSSVSSEAYIHIVGVGDSESDTNNAYGSLHQWNLRDNFNVQAGKHLLKLGMDERRIASHLHPAALSVQADFLDRDSMLNNSVSALVVTATNPANPILNQFSVFAQDDWKMSKALSLSLGLRWEFAPPPKGEHGQDASTMIGDVNTPASLKLAPRGTPLWHTGWYNFAPRAGVAWAENSEPGKELIVRAGSGVFFDTSNQPALRAFSGLGFANSIHFANQPLPVTPAELNVPPPGSSPYGGTNAFAFPSHLQLPYSWQWDIAVEKALGRSQTLTASYVGASGQRLLEEQRRNVNQANPDFGDITFYPSGLTSSYQAMQLKFQRSLVQGVQTLVSYTWAHGLDYGSTDPAFPLIHGNSDLDVRHNVEAAVSWDVPRPSGSSRKRNLFGGWRIDGRLLARTGFPVDLGGNFFLDTITGNTYASGVNFIPQRPLYLHGPGSPGGRIFNGGINAANPAFSLPQGDAQGDAPRNLVRGLSALQGNAGIRRAFQLHDSLNFQIGMEMFNVTNHPNFGYVDPYLPDLLFGQPTKLLNQSFGPTGSIYQQGGPRSMQISLRLTF